MAYLSPAFKGVSGTARARVWSFRYLGFSAIALFAAITLPLALRPLALGTAGGLLALAVLTLAAWGLRGQPCAAAIRTALRAVRQDFDPVFLTDPAGVTLAQNPAAAGAGPGDALLAALGQRVADPAALVARLAVRAAGSGRAEEVLPDGMALRVGHCGRHLLKWTLSPVSAAETPPADAAADLPAGDAVSAEAAFPLDRLPVPGLRIAPDGAILDLNAEARAILQIPDGQPPPLCDLVEGMGRPVNDWLADAVRGRGLAKPEIVRASLPGRELFLQITLGRTETAAGVSLYGLLNDATEIKTLEAQFVQSQKMQAIGQLAGGVAHDFNNLLTAIGGHCDLLLLRHDEGDPDYADLIQISQNANRAASLVGQLLAFSRKQNLRPQALDLRDTMADLVHLLNRLIGEKIRLEVAHEPGNHIIRADRRQLEQVIINLVLNARDAMPEGGCIAIRTACIRLVEALERDKAQVSPGDYVLITVSDSGDGIPAEALPKIFEPFYTTKKTGEGTGLGLSTAYGIVKQTGGFIFADSTPDEGTRFSLYFPPCDDRAGAIEAAVAPKSPAPQLHGDGVVLLVEDEAPVRAFASRALRMRGYTVIEAESAEDALAALENEALEIDVFVTDVVMPGMDGPTWVREALKKRPDTRVIFVSGYAEESRAENQARIPNSVFLPKPFSLSQLTSLVYDQLH